MNIKEIRKATNMTQKEFSQFLQIPQRTIEEWEAQRRKPAPYIIRLIVFYLVKNDKLSDDYLNV